MKQEVLERRLDLLKLEGNGLLPAEIVKELSVKYNKTERNIYYDFETKHKWQPQLEQLEKALLTVINRHDQLYRKASLNYIKAENQKQKLYALNLMRQINKDAFDILANTGKIELAVRRMEVKEEISERLEVVHLNVTENEDDILNKAAAILDKRLSEKKQPTEVHTGTGV